MVLTEDMIRIMNVSDLSLYENSNISYVFDVPYLIGIATEIILNQKNYLVYCTEPVKKKGSYCCLPVGISVPTTNLCDAFLEAKEYIRLRDEKRAFHAYRREIKEKRRNFGQIRR